MIVITGATGTVGSELVRLLVDGGSAVRAVTRTPGKTRFDPAVEVVAGDLDQPDSLTAAFDGAERVFVLVPGHDTSHDHAVVDAARRAGVAHLVRLSTTGVEFGATDPISTGHRAGERVLAKAGLPWTVLRPGTFMSNLLGSAETIRAERALHVTEDPPVSAMIHPRDIAAVAALVLTTPGHEGRTYPLTGGAALTAQQQAEVIGEVLGHPITVVERTAAQTRADFERRGWGGHWVDELFEIKRQAAAWDWRVFDTVERLTGTPPRTLREWVTENAARLR
ncbi:NAD(P)H-binding protein [Actinokineospora sp. NBRC 105648]|uniref:NAD(P)H-binding protein n=1 Tax=Actinokineospora sp. NBRC 105648 TaxID=3032206 RepID=UPI0024A42AE0|nr:NAD(P)H-binding protein [Actinokineospora sp. NBRC 105648]GLZ37192.1 nucleotide-diphosphate-sugar epimerase [Actinokineospora sp. NBRC 105648]